MITIKKISGLLAATLLLSAGTAFGQDGSTDNGGIAANASVLSAIDVIAGVSLEFGNVSPNITKTVKTDGTVSGGAATGTERAGTFAITKGTNSYISLEFTALPSTLGGDNSTTMGISFADAESGAVKFGLVEVAAVTPGEGSNPPTFGTGTNALAFSATQELNLENSATDVKPAYFAATGIKVTIGGVLSPAVDQASGTYTGTITLTASYN